jgi:Yersinia/Haemophilus virulence surface antigen
MAAVPPLIPLVNRLASAARTHKCSYSRFRQLDYVDQLQGQPGAGGVCYGLAVTWLETKLRIDSTDSYTDYFNRPWITDSQVGNRNGGLMFQRSLLFFGQQNADAVHWQTETGLMPARDGDGSHKQKTFEYPNQLSDFVTWLGKAKGTRYFLVHMNPPRGTDQTGHTMAAYGSKTGKMEFFDPNAGIVGTRLHGRLLGCLNDFLSAPQYNVYRRRRPNAGDLTQPYLFLDVEKFKPAPKPSEPLTNKVKKFLHRGF